MTWAWAGSSWPASSAWRYGYFWRWCGRSARACWWGSRTWALRGLDPIFQVCAPYRRWPGCPFHWQPSATAIPRRSSSSSSPPSGRSSSTPRLASATSRGLPQRRACHPPQRRGVLLEDHVAGCSALHFLGLRIGVGLSWLAIVAAEMLIGGVGIGFFIWDAWNSSRISDIMLALFYVGIVGFMLDRLVAWPAISSPAAPRLHNPIATPRGVQHHEHPTSSLADRHELSSATARPIRCSRGISIDVEQGEFISLIGHSGCGKSTVLNIVAGLAEKHLAGGVILDGSEVNEPRPGPRRGVPEPLTAALADCLPKRRDRGEQDLPQANFQQEPNSRDWILHNLDMVNMSHALNGCPQRSPAA
jgi:hypothetical protein